MTNLPNPEGAAAQVDPMSLYEQERAALLAADTTGYIDPHFTDGAGDPDAEPVAGEQEAAAEPAPTEGVVVAPDAELQGIEAKPQARPPHFRIRPRNALDAAAIMHLKQNPELSFEEAVRMARCMQNGDTSPPADEISPGVMETDEGEALARPGHPHDHAFHSSASAAAGLIPQQPELRDEFLGRMAMLDQILGQSGDPLFGSPNKPMVLAQIVAREMRAAALQPWHGQAEPAMQGMMSREGARPLPARMTAPLAGGTVSTNTSQGLLDKQIGEIRTPDDYRRLVGRLLGRK